VAGTSSPDTGETGTEPAAAAAPRIRETKAALVQARDDALKVAEQATADLVTARARADEADAAEEARGEALREVADLRGQIADLTGPDGDTDPAEGGLPVVATIRADGSLDVDVSGLVGGPAAASGIVALAGRVFEAVPDFSERAAERFHTVRGSWAKMTEHDRANAVPIAGPWLDAMLYVAAEHLTGISPDTGEPVADSEPAG